MLLCGPEGRAAAEQFELGNLGYRKYNAYGVGAMAIDITYIK